MQWDHDVQYPGAMPAAHPNGARRVTELSVSPRDADRFRRWTVGADAPLRIPEGCEPGLLSVTVETARGEITITA